jgi:Gram-negative bacterial TonB protein C-terminal
MSKSLLVASFMLLVAPWMFPSQVPAQTRVFPLAADGPGISVEPGAKVLERPPVSFPPGVTTNGSVTVKATVGAAGEVIDARVVRGPEQLRRAALLSVLNWRFAADGVRTVLSTIRFTSVRSGENSCLNGVWAQDQPSDWRWRFQAEGDRLTISRTDGFVSGAFTPAGRAWSGNLQWGTGETWNGVVLTPAENCREVRSNQSWWFKR